jgi:hypothetical protein
MFETQSVVPTLTPPAPGLDTASRVGFPSPLRDPMATPLSSIGSSARAIAFIDAGLSDYQTLVNGLQPGTAIYRLNPVLPELPWLPLDMECSHFQEMPRFRWNQSVHSPADLGLNVERSV